MDRFIEISAFLLGAVILIFAVREIFFAENGSIILGAIYYGVSILDFRAGYIWRKGRHMRNKVSSP
jgi:hypothetical protein